MADGLQFTRTGALGVWAVEMLTADLRAEETVGNECFHHQDVKYQGRTGLPGAPVQLPKWTPTKLMPGQCYIFWGDPSFPQSSVHSWMC